MKKQSKILFIVAGIFLLAAGCSKQVSQPVSGSANQQNQQPTTAQPSGQTQIRQNDGGQKPGQLTVTQTVEGSNLNKLSHEVTQGQTAMGLLEATHKVDVKTYSGIGNMVTGIDGNKADSKHFWEFFVNKKSSNVGAASYVLKAGDKIEWKLSSIKYN